MAGRPTSCLVLGTLSGATALVANDMVKLCPRGAYTTARTYARRCVFEFEAHAARTADSARLMMQDEHASQADTALWASSSDPRLLRPALRDSFRFGIESLLRSTHGPGWREHLDAAGAGGGTDMNAGELKLTTVSVWGAERVAAAVDTLLPQMQQPWTTAAGAPIQDVAEARAFLHSSAANNGSLPPTLLITHVTHLPSRRRPPVTAVVRGAPRHNALAKDSEWVRQRTSLEATKPADVEEILLMDEATGSILEGTQTNFFAVDGEGTVYTAGEGVLEGTVRRLVLEVCGREGIRVKLEAPKLGEADTWVGAFLSSTSRLVLPLNAVQLPAEGAGEQAGSGGPGAGSSASALRTLQLDTGGVVAKIEAGVRAAVASTSMDVFAEAA